MDWLDCDIIEQIPGKVSGAPLIRGSRVRSEDVISNIDLPPEEIAEEFDLRIEDVRAVLAFYWQHKGELAPHS